MEGIYITSIKINSNSDEYPKRLLKINGYPRKLQYIGNEELLNSKRIIAIVGSRDCSEYGRKYAGVFAAELAKYNICIISGLAIGIDAAAHQGAMYEIGRTIAVLGGGIHRLYPPENRWLYNEIIANNGCIITEYDDDKEARLSGFPRRNRIISGMADGVLIIESKRTGGTRVTARYAKMQQKKLYCIPHNLGNKNGEGVNELLVEGAQIVTNPMQIVKDMYGKEKLPDPNTIENQTIQVSKEYRQIFHLLKERSMTKDEISRQIEKDISETNAILTMMELEGYIYQIAGNLFKIRKA